jgi:DNA mismatch repair protein MutS
MPAERGQPAGGLPSDTAALTPAMRQYAEQKAQAGDAVLLFRMGDFYETFYDDAKLLARVLGIALTSRSKHADEPIPLAGIPYHALDGYLAKLVSAGYRVAISEQVEDPKQAKGVVRREITRIVTPGTLTDDALLASDADNLLAAVCLGAGEQAGIAWIELASGDFWTHGCPRDALLDELQRLRPAELLLPERNSLEPDEFEQTFREQVGAAISTRPRFVFAPFHAQQALHKQFGVTTLAGFGYEQFDLSLCAAGAVLHYLAETQKSQLAHVRSIRRRPDAELMLLDPATLHSLEVERTIRGESRQGSLLAAVDRTVSAMGSRRLRRWLLYPLRQPAAIRARQEAIGQLGQQAAALRQVRSELRDISDLERIVGRLGLGRSMPRDLVGLLQTLDAVPRLRDTLQRAMIGLGEHQVGELCPVLQQLAERLGGHETLAAYLHKAIRPDAPSVLRDGGVIADGFSAELDELRSVSSDGHRWLADLQAREVRRTGITSLKVGFNKVFGYYIEVTNAHRDRVPAEYVRKQTVKNAERYVTDELKQYESKVLTARERAIALEAELFEIIRKQVVDHLPALHSLGDALAGLDTLAGLAHLAAERHYVCPELTDDDVLIITEGRHPVLEQTLAERFVPNDVQLGGDGPRTILLTGPNMSGKSTYIRQVALLVLLAQTGSWVPAESMRFRPMDRVFTRVGAADEIARGQSTFMVEMTETANILHHATGDSLVILDEVGRGTSTFDGLALAWAVTEHLASASRCKTLFATHYHELTELADLLEGVANFNVAVREWQDEVVFLHKIVPGGTDRSYGLHVARLAGVPRAIVERARNVLAELEAGFRRETQTPQLASRRTRKPADGQLELFVDPAEHVADELRALDVDHLTPIDALRKLKNLQDQMKTPGQ